MEKKRNSFRPENGSYNFEYAGDESSVDVGFDKTRGRSLRQEYGGGSLELTDTKSESGYDGWVGKSFAEYRQSYDSGNNFYYSEQNGGFQPGYSAYGGKKNNEMKPSQAVDWLDALKRSPAQGKEKKNIRSKKSSKKMRHNEKLGKANLRSGSSDENFDYGGSKRPTGSKGKTAGRRRPRRRKIKKLPCFLLFFVVLLLIFGICRLVGGNGDDNAAQGESIPVFSEEFWQSKIYVGEDVIHGTDQTLVIPRSSYDSYISAIGGEQNADRFLYYRKVANGSEQVNYLKSGSVFDVDTSKTLIALSFDDGPDPKTIDKYLAILKEYNASATFFMLGQRMEANPDAVAKIKESGNEPATHTWNHKNFKKATDGDVDADLQRSSEVFENLIGYPPYLVRAPYGNTTDAFKSKSSSLGMISCMWNIDTLDWRRHDVAAIVDSVKANASPGSVILMHEGKKLDLEALPQILEWLNAQGYKVVSVGELLWQLHENGEDGLNAN